MIGLMWSRLSEEISTSTIFMKNGDKRYNCSPFWTGEGRGYKAIKSVGQMPLAIPEQEAFYLRFLDRVAEENGRRTSSFLHKIN